MTAVWQHRHPDEAGETRSTDAEILDEACSKIERLK
jgi:hypothetical protein